jgi:NADH:ubiquinone oxidoreductase subunit F (NADH-binding)
MAERGLVLGHGGLVAVHAGADWTALLRHWLRFMAHESCGKCAPCRVGSKRALTLANEASPGEAERRELERLLEVIAESSLCAFGQLMPKPIRQLLERASEQENRRAP